VSKETAKEVLRAEAEAVRCLADRVGAEFERAEELVMATKGRVIVTGLGKSGIVGRKIAATLSSIGIPAYFLHPVEGAHGDIGMVMRGDTAIVISKSGATDELTVILNHCRRLEIPVIALTTGTDSALTRIADVVLDVSVDREACPYNIVPTASTTATMAMGDALAMSLFERKGLTEQDFADLHPGGSLGRKLTYRVRDIMHSGDELPLADIGASMRDVVAIMSARKLGIAIITEDGRLAGTISDGDLRRLLQRVGSPLEIDARTALEKSAREDGVRTEPLTVGPDAFVGRAAGIMERNVVTTLVVADDDGVPEGLIRWIDLSLAGVV
jgi:arabinose-5-phosphate isomerase